MDGLKSKVTYKFDEAAMLFLHFTAGKGRTQDWVSWAHPVLSESCLD